MKLRPEIFSCITITLEEKLELKTKEKSDIKETKSE
jgi:hypothetical protein